MDRFYAVVITAITVRNPGFVAEISVIGVGREKIVQAVAERQSIVVKLLGHQVVLTGGIRITRRGWIPERTRPHVELSLVQLMIGFLETDLRYSQDYQEAP